MSIYSALRPLLFRCDPETSHGLGMAALRVAQAVPGAVRLLAWRHRVADPALRQALFGRQVLNPVGLAAGFDKDAVAIAAMPALGFGFIEVGTVTPLPQAGNPRPRLFRHAAERSLQNSLGFNNRGLAAMGRRLERSGRHTAVQQGEVGVAGEHGAEGLDGEPRTGARAGRRGEIAANETHEVRGAGAAGDLLLGVNVGKGRDTKPADALADYETLLRALGPFADYLVVNLSSPNTPGLRDLQNESFVRDLFQAARAVTGTPVLVKLSPDLAPEAAATLAETAVDAGAAGIVATNTTIDYSLLPGARPQGGLSGQVLRATSLRVFTAIAHRLQGRALLISAGGIDSGAEAYRRLRAGASLVQVYTSLVYEGPTLARRINRELLILLARDGFTHLTQAIGADLR